MLLISWASSSRTAATCSLSSGGSTVLAFDIEVKANDREASITPPASARPKERPNDPAAEFTPAASLMRSPEIGARV